MSAANIFKGLYLLAALGCLAGRLLDEPLATQLDYIFKPMLMPFLALYLSVSAARRWNGNLTWLLIALFFAFGGDMALMLGNGGLLFILGLASFLVMQLMYIRLFSKDWVKPSFLARQPFWGVLLVAIGAAFYFLSLQQLLSDPVMVGAVAVYALALVGMALSALNRKEGVGDKGFRLLLLGALLFFASDLMIGFNKFIVPDFPLAGFCIMITYIAGQWLIVDGYLCGQEEKLKVKTV